MVVMETYLTHFYLAPLSASSCLHPHSSSRVPQPAGYFEDLTGTSAVHSFHMNPLCREEFSPSQVMNSNELCNSSALQLMTSLPSLLAAAQLPFLTVNPTDEGIIGIT